MRKPILILVILAALSIAGFFLFNRYIYNQKQADVTTVPAPYRGTLTGEFVCLPLPAGALQTSHNVHRPSRPIRMSTMRSISA